MEMSAQKRFSGPVTVFQEKRLPEAATLAGYAALIDAYDLRVPLPRLLCATGSKHRIYEQDGWRITTPRHAPDPTLEGHLNFALKYEGLDLAVLKRLFLATGPGPIEEIVRATPTGSYARRIWFLYEWLTGERLDLPDADKGSYFPVVDEKMQYAIPGQTSSRHRVKNNLPGTPEFCPLVFRTEDLDRFIAMDLPQRAKDAIADVPRNLLARTAAFLLLKDSRSSYAIEGERAPQNRIQRWGRAIGQAGKQPLDLEELLRLQRIVIEDARFVTLGLREEGGFVGEHELETRMPLPDHISARPEDLELLVSGMIAFDAGPAQKFDAVIAAAVLASGFVYIHPFVDGNGRIHRYLIHHLLSQRGFNPPGVVFPVSSAILERIDDYKDVLEDYSARLLPVIEWEPTADGNVHVLNDTGDFYRYFDATPHAGFLYGCVQKTIEEDLPQETEFLRRYDQFRARIQTIADMPDSMSDLLFNFLRQNSGALSKRARDKEFAALTSDEVRQVEDLYSDVFS
jgi:Fic/DOC family